MDPIEFAILGATAGVLYALMALGIVVVNRSTGVINFASGAIGAFAAFAFYDLRDKHGIPTYIALPLGLLCGAVLSALMYALVIARMRTASTLAKMIASLAVLTMLRGVISLIWGTGPRLPKSYLPSGTWTFWDGIRLGHDRLIIAVGACVLVAFLGVVYTRSTFGLATTAVAENRTVLQCAGRAPRRVELVNFVVAGGLYALAAISIAPITGLEVSTLTLLVIPALAAALVGQFQSFTYTLIGAIGIGVIESEFGRYVDEPGVAQSMPLVVIVVMMIIGGNARTHRGERASLLPLPGTGKVRPGVLVVVVAVVTLGITTLSASWVDSITTTLVTVIAVLSVVVLTGYAGQLSLAQIAVAGFGAWVAARFAVNGVPFEWAALLAVVLTIPVGLLVAIPALRTRGVNLAVATLAMALVIERMVLTNVDLTGGFDGLKVPAPSVLGINVDPIQFPERYALLALAAAVGCGLVVANVRRGRVGLRLLAVRSNERAAEALGINVFVAKLYAFALASAIAAIAGVLLGFRNPIILFTNFSIFGSLEMVLYAVVGGAASVAGAPMGALMAPGGLTSRVTHSLFYIGDWLSVIAGVAVVLVLIQDPNGVIHHMSGLGKKLKGLRRRRPVITPKSPPAPTRAAPRRAERTPGRLDVTEVSVRFGGIHALTGVTFHVDPGEVLGIIGPNGAGKTTLVDVISGFTRPVAGHVSLDGVDVSRWSPVRRARAGICRSFQAVELFDELTVRENLLAAADRHEGVRYATDMVRPGRLPTTMVIEAIIKEFDLAAVLDERPGALSSGLARMVGIARTIVAEPRVLLLDEPAAGLDAVESMQLSPVIRRIAHDRGTPVVLIEHDVDLVLSTCDRIVVLDWGRVIAEGTPTEVWQNADVRTAYFGDTVRSQSAVPNERDLAHVD